MVKSLLKVAPLLFLTLSTNASHADTEYTTPFEASEIAASPMAANTSKSLASAARMGHYAWRGTTPPDEDTIRFNCTANTGVSPWPNSCNPTGMVTALHNNNSGSWVQSINEAGDGANAVNAQVSHLTGSLHSPNVVPIYGHADHWAINHAIWTDPTGAVDEFDFYDGGPAGERDGSHTGYLSGDQYTDPATWSSIFFKVITSVPTTDTYYNRYVNLWEPPVSISIPAVSYAYRLSPSPLAQGTKVTAQLARDLALKSLQIAGLTRHPAEWAILAASTPATPYEVAGVYPDGRAWDYFMVPFVNQDNMTVALAMFEKDTLRFQMATVLKQALPFQGNSSAQALAIAQTALSPGESLGASLLTWDPAASSDQAASPLVPYYEFPVYSAGRRVGSTVVGALDGQVGRLTVDQMSRRLAP